VLAHSAALNVTQFELFSLRDADSSSPEPLGSLGLVTDTYRRKAAFDRYAGRSGSEPAGVGWTGVPGSSVLP
jgi:hypothetical protein